MATYHVHITHDASEWQYWERSPYRFTTKHTSLVQALIDLENMSLGKPIATSTLEVSNIKYGLRFTLSLGQKSTTLEEPVLKIRREKTASEKAVEVTVAGNGKKYVSSFPQRERFISFNDMVLTLQEAPGQIRHWRILLDNDSLTEFDGVKNRDIVALQPEEPPMDVENAPDLLQDWWHMFYPYWYSE
ncbi:MAG: hypothetical protein JOZ18_07955 [Chloroflexi bacterium]|nr:hypothetical protein [Chloroflexota bacterium]